MASQAIRVLYDKNALRTPDHAAGFPTGTNTPLPHDEEIVEHNHLRLGKTGSETRDRRYFACLGCFMIASLLVH
jgi:hypothetical protein